WEPVNWGGVWLPHPVPPLALPRAPREPAPPGRAGAVCGLTVPEAESLLDWLQERGCTGLEAALEAGCVTAPGPCPPGVRLGRGGGWAGSGPAPSPCPRARRMPGPRGEQRPDARPPPAALAPVAPVPARSAAPAAGPPRVGYARSGRPPTGPPADPTHDTTRS